jgi:hypothetical protein
MTTAKWTINTREQQDLHYLLARFNEKGVCQCGVEVLQSDFHQLGNIMQLVYIRNCKSSSHAFKGNHLQSLNITIYFKIQVFAPSPTNKHYSVHSICLSWIWPLCEEINLMVREQWWFICPPKSDFHNLEIVAFTALMSEVVKLGELHWDQQIFVL